MSFAKLLLPMNARVCRLGSIRLMSQLGDLGSGAGRGGGDGGSIRSAGGAFGKMEAAKEGEYFYRKEKEQLKKMKEALHDQISFHKEQIDRHQEAIERSKMRIKSIMEDNS